MMKKIAITAIGISCCAGSDTESFFKNLLSSENKRKNFVKLTNDLNINISVYKAPDDCFATIKEPRFSNPTSQICLKAAKECYENYVKDYGKPPIDSIIVGTSTGGQYFMEKSVYSLIENKKCPNFNYRDNVSMSVVSDTIMQELKIDSRIMTVSTACTSSANAIIIGASQIEQGISECVLAGGGDSLCDVTTAGFHILQLTSDLLCSPFNKNKSGITLGEGAAFYILEPLDKVLRENRKYLALISGYGMSCDAYHLTAPSPEGKGASLCIRSALKKAGLEPHDISFINAHGTGSEYNDSSEALAINNVFGNKVPTASLKGFVGHTLGGAGAIEGVASIFSIIHKKAFENYNNYEQNNDYNLTLVKEGGLKFDHSPIVLSSSFAFSGNNCTLIFSGE